MRAIITRFAPAPTGFLHLGHVVNAVYVWGVARAIRSAADSAGPRVLLRIEDHDRQRSRPVYEEAILEDLAWLGFAADEPFVRQSERGDIYTHTLDMLRAQGLVYACACTRAEIASAASRSSRRAGPSGPAEPAATPGPEGPGLRGDAAELWYPGTCRDRGLAEGPGVGIRVRLAASTERFDDLRHGPQAQRPHEQCGDVLVRDRDGQWTYQFAAAVDDWVQGVTLVIRGDDLLASTGRQLQLARLAGRAEPPAFLHHPLIMKSATQKLSKSDGDTGVRDLRARGWSAARVVGHACFRAGLIPDDRDVAAAEVSSIMGALSWVR